MEGNYISFRKAKVGGFNKKDVIAYIEKMRNDFFDYKKAVEATIDQLNAKVRELETACEGNNQPAAVACEATVEAVKSVDPVTDINEATTQLRMVADELCKNLTDFMSKMNCAENHESEDKNQKPEIFEDVEAYIEETAKEIFEVAQESEEPKADKVAEILSSSANFSFSKDEEKEEKATDAVEDEKKSILDTLSSSSFFN